MILRLKFDEGAPEEILVETAAELPTQAVCNGSLSQSNIDSSSFYAFIFANPNSRSRTIQITLIWPNYTKEGTY